MSNSDKMRVIKTTWCNLWLRFGYD